LGLTQEDLADKAAIHRTYLSDIERGTRNLGLINIEIGLGSPGDPV
jgi:transcriptional regulator with XRE-family HTH domain